MRWALLVLLLSVSVAPAAFAQDAGPDPRSILGAPKGAPLQGAELDRRTQQVAGVLRCPVCQGLSVADSPSGMATKMRGQVRELLAAGYDQDQVLAYFERSYGEFVRLEPPLRGVNWIVWLAPAAGLLAGSVLIGVVLKRRAARAPAVDESPLPGPDTLPDDPRLAAYVLKVRERAYGWPGGVKPAS